MRTCVHGTELVNFVNRHFTHALSIRRVVSLSRVLALGVAVFWYRFLDRFRLLRTRTVRLVLYAQVQWTVTLHA